MKQEIALVGSGFCFESEDGLPSFFNQINHAQTGRFQTGNLTGQPLRGFPPRHRALIAQCLKQEKLLHKYLTAPDGFGFYDGSHPDAKWWSLSRKPHHLIPASDPVALKTGDAVLLAEPPQPAAACLPAIQTAAADLRSGEIDFAVVCAVQDEWAPDAGYPGQATDYPAPAFGLSFAMTTLENALREGLDTEAVIHLDVSSRKRAYEEPEEVLLRLMERLFRQGAREKDIDAVILAGSRNFEVGKLLEDLWWELDIAHAKVHLPERLFGIADHNGGGIGLLYALGLARHKVTRTSLTDFRKGLVGAVDPDGNAGMLYISC
ncbi:MAG TPA: hypothetical protein PKB07_03385 [Flavilitoribacter sp.]|nr:hypothetical protein [Flavilitoribacter sp.]